MLVLEIDFFRMPRLNLRRCKEGRGLRFLRKYPLDGNDSSAIVSFATYSEFQDIYIYIPMRLLKLYETEGYLIMKRSLLYV